MKRSLLILGYLDKIHTSFTEDRHFADSLFTDPRQISSNCESSHMDARQMANIMTVVKNWTHSEDEYFVALCVTLFVISQ